MFSAWKCIDLVAYNVYTMFTFVIANLTNGYVKFLSPVKQWSETELLLFPFTNIRWRNKAGFFSTRKTRVITKNTKIKTLVAS